MKKLSWIEIAALYIGVIMGAGFASGRECWQFFGVFGRKGYLGAAAGTLCFVLLACMLTYIARSKGTSDLGRLISPFDNEVIDGAVGWVLAAVYYSMIIAMTAAGGSLLNQQFGISKVIGGSVIALLCIITVLGDFERVSKIFRLMVPVLFAVSVLTIILTIRADFAQSGATEGYRPGRMSPNWPVSALVFIAYNTLGMITMAGSSAVNAKDRKNAYAGAVTGTLCLGLLTLLLLRALLSDMAVSGPEHGICCRPVRRCIFYRSKHILRFQHKTQTGKNKAHRHNCRRRGRFSAGTYRFQKAGRIPVSGPGLYRDSIHCADNYQFHHADQKTGQK